jgi:Icc-related predicted phosphoesterase
MKILAITDKVIPQIYDASIKTRFADVDLVLSCGDLPNYYLEYVVTMLNVPLYYVTGNHGRELEYTPSGERRRPGGCVDIDEQVVEYGGLWIAGLEGSMRYKQGPYQYTQRQMSHKALRLGAKLLRNRLLKGRSLDVLVTHAPPFGIHDGKDLCHTGFRALLKFMDRYKPQYLIHGHSHVYNRLQPTTTQYHDTAVINAYPYRILEVSRAERQTGSDAG